MHTQGCATHDLGCPRSCGSTLGLHRAARFGALGSRLPRLARNAIRSAPEVCEKHCRRSTAITSRRIWCSSHRRLKPLATCCHGFTVPSERLVFMFLPEHFSALIYFRIPSRRKLDVLFSRAALAYPPRSRASPRRVPVAQTWRDRSIAVGLGRH